MDNFKSLLDQYADLATTTESVPDTINVDIELLQMTTDSFVAASEILDQVKRHAYYGSDYDNDKINHYIDQIVNAALLLQSYRNEGNVNTNDTVINDNIRLIHGMLGIATESGELAVLLPDIVLNKPFDKVNIQEEMADINWYQAIVHKTLSLNWVETLNRNINKLRKRFPNKFNSHDALNRKLDAERKELEG